MIIVDENGVNHEILQVCTCKRDIMLGHLERVSAILDACENGADFELLKLIAEGRGKLDGMRIYLGEYL